MTDAQENQRRDLPARDIRLRQTGRDDRPIGLVLGLETDDGRASGAAHGVLLTTPGAHMLLFDLADALGLAVRLPLNPGALNNTAPQARARSYREVARIEADIQ